MKILISILALLVALVAAAGSIAGLTDEGRARLARWASQTYRVGYTVFMGFSILNGAIGVILFALATTPPPAKISSRWYFF